MAPTMKTLNALMLPLFFGGLTATSTAAQPNIIFIVTDDHGYNDLEATDLRGEVNMPNLHRLSTGGALMTQGYCTAPQCVPSRAGIVTGRYQQRFGIDANPEGPLPLSQKSIATRLQTLGYTTAHVGKWHLKVNRGSRRWLQKNGYQTFADVPTSQVNSCGPQAFGYDWFAEGPSQRVWCNFDIHGNSLPAQSVNYRVYENRAHAKKFRVELQTELALAFIKRQVDKPKPFFLYLGYYGPHVPLDAPTSLTSQVLSLEELERKGYDHTKVMIKKSVNYAKDYTAAEVRQQGLALLKGIDNGVGDIYQLLAEKDVLENTLIVFMSDNGAPLGRSWDGSVNDPWHGSKGIIFEGGSRIPFIVHWKGVVAPQIYDHGVITLDAGATAVAAAGGNPASDPLLDGVDLLPALKDKNRKPPSRLLYQRFMNTASITEGKMKFMRHANGEELLFDVTMEKPGAYNPQHDFHESVNLLDAMPETATRLRKQLHAWTQQLAKPHYDKGFHASLYQFIEGRWELRQGTRKTDRP